MDAQLARLEEQVKALAVRLGAVEREIGSKRDPDSVRGRLHIFESDRSAAKATAAALEELRRDRNRSWGTREKVALTLVALIAAPGTIAVPWLTLYLQLHGGH